MESMRLVRVGRDPEVVGMRGFLLLLVFLSNQVWGAGGQHDGGTWDAAQRGGAGGAGGAGGVDAIGGGGGGRGQQQQQQQQESLPPVVGMYQEGMDLCLKGERGRCIELLQKSLAIDGNQALASFNLGHALRGEGRWHEAAEAYLACLGSTRALAGSAEPAPADIQRDAGVWRGRIMIEDDKWDEAIEAFDHVVTTHGDSPEALYRLLYLQHFAVNFTGRAVLMAKMKETLRAEIESTGGTRMTPSQSLMLIQGEDIKSVSQVYSAGHVVSARKALGPLGEWVWDLGEASPDARSVHALSAYGQVPNRDGRLRIGYLSKDLGFSSVGQLLPSLFSEHDRRRVEVFVYALNTDDGSECYKALRKSPENWADMGDKTPLDIATRLNAEGINIVIDLGGPLSVKSQIALAMQPSPIAVNYLSWLSTQASPYIQYFLTDRIATPVELASHHTESLAFVPWSYQVNSNRRMHPDANWHPKARYTIMHPASSDDEGMEGVREEDAVVFANYNQLFKVGEDTFKAWSSVLKSRPNSVLSLLNFTGSPAGSRGLSQAMNRAGVSAGRMRFSPFCVDKNDFLMLSSGADLFLDNFFYNAGTTGSDVLYAGVPIVTLPGSRTLARMGASLLTALGFRDLIARTPQDYVDIAVRASRDGRALAQLKARLARRVQVAPFFDTSMWVHDYEALLFGMWDAALADGVKTGQWPGVEKGKSVRQIVISRDRHEVYRNPR